MSSLKINDYRNKILNGDVREMLRKLNLNLGYVSEDTEILTEQGWRNIDNLSEQHLVATFNVGGNYLEYQRVNKISRVNYKGKMIRISNRHTNQLFTPNQKVLHKNKKHSGKRQWVTDWQFTLAEKIKFNNGLIMPLSAKLNSNNSIGGTQIAELLGWIISEGSFSDKRGYRVRVYQSETANPEKVVRIRNLLEYLNIPYRERFDILKYNGSKRICFSFAGEWGKKIRLILPKKKPTWSMLFLNYKELKALWEGLMLGDGSGWSFYQKDEYTREWFRVLCLHLGKRTVNNDKRISVQSCDRTTTELSRNSTGEISKIEYEGKVWSVSVPNKTFIARRKGMYFITGDLDCIPKEHLDQLTLI